jgi:hypothetical protein
MLKLVAFCLLLADMMVGANLPRHEVTYDAQWSSAVPTFDKGYVFAWDDPALGHYTLYGPGGEKLYEVVIRPPESRRVSLRSAAVDTDGTLAVAYKEWPTSGEEHGAIVLLNAVGKPIRFIRTGDYFPTQVCFAPDHSFWTMGQKLHPGSDYAVFRKFSRSGEQLAAFVPRSSLPVWEGNGLDQLTSPVLGFWTMRAISDRLGALLKVSAFKSEWFELDFSGKVLGMWSIVDDPDHSWQPAAFVSGGVLYANIWEGHATNGVAVLDKTNDKWKPVKGLRNGYLMGSDRDRLVFEIRPHQLLWVQTELP